MARRHRLQVHFERLTVKVNPEKASGIGMYQVDDLDPDHHYRVLITYMHRYEDGSTVPAFVLEGPDGALIERACTIFKVGTLFGSEQK